MPTTGPPRRGPAVRIAFALSALWAGTALAHDIPNARVDRSIQVTVEPGRLRVAYEVSLSELTLTQELRSLVGILPGSDRAGWFAAYGRETGPLNAKGFLVDVGGEPVPLQADGFDLVVEEHPRYTFRFSAPIPPEGRLSVHDTNFGSSEGTSRLAVRGEGVQVRGDDLPSDVEAVPVRPVWQLSDEEEHRTHQVVVRYAASAAPDASRSPVDARPVTKRRFRARGLSRLLDGDRALPLAALALLAFGLGGVHAVQPGHGKTLVAAVAAAGRGEVGRAALLAAVLTLTHTGSVFLVAGGLWWTGSSRFGEVHRALAKGSGFVIGAVGLWRLGRHLGGFFEHGGESEALLSARAPARGVVALGVAGGLVPCWDAVGLVVLSSAVGRLALGLGLVAAFGLGMGLVLAGVGWVAARLRGSVFGGRSEPAWERRLGLASGLALAALGVTLFRVS